MSKCRSIDLVEGITMKIFVLLTLLSLSAWSQDPSTYLKNFDAKVYSLKTKGIKDFVVDIESPKITKQINDQKIFGEIEKIYFRTYWTANPERIAIEIHGMPEGFKEVKEELKSTILSMMDNLLPVATLNRFAGYKIISTANPKELLAQDTTGIALIPSFTLRFDNQDKIIEVIAKKPVGTLVITPKYEKDSFSDGKWVLKSQTTNASENGQVIISRKELTYASSQGIGVLAKIKTSIEQKLESGGVKPLNSGETIELKNYKINTGDAMKFFLSEGTKTSL